MDNKKINIKTTGFKTPEDYFESFDDIILNRLSETKELETPKDTGFSIPKDYFNTIEGSILQKINTTKDKPVVKLWSKKTLIYISGIAVSLIVFFNVFDNNTNNDITIDMVESHLQNSDLDSYELAELLVETKFLEDDFTIIEPEYEDANLETYLLNNSDIETILDY